MRVKTSRCPLTLTLSRDGEREQHVGGVIPSRPAGGDEPRHYFSTKQARKRDIAEGSSPPDWSLIVMVESAILPALLSKAQ